MKWPAQPRQNILLRDLDHRRVRMGEEGGGGGGGREVFEEGGGGDGVWDTPNPRVSNQKNGLNADYTAESANALEGEEGGVAPPPPPYGDV